ncbi:MAG: serine/threonine-protein kinase [Cyanobacteria bacterium P01_F01_bin.53]
MSDDISNQPEFPSGTLIDNQYLIQKVLGHGGLGRTYLALDVKRFHEPCVLKEFSPRVKGDRILKKSRALFKREAKILYQLEHPQIPKFFATFESAGRLFLVQEFVNGRTYLSFIKERQKLRRSFSEREILDWLNKLLPVLDYIHQLGIIHRDISPDNVMLPADSELPVLIDFGVGKQVLETLPQVSNDPNYSGYVSRLSIVGKLGYSPPEQIRQGICTPSSDLYALGVVALVLLTAKEPASLINQRTLQWEWRTFAQVSSGFAHILDKMISAAPPDRYQSAVEVMRALKEISQPAQPDQPAQALRQPYPEMASSVEANQSQSNPAEVSVKEISPETTITPQSLKSPVSAVQKRSRRPSQPVLAIGLTLIMMIVAGVIAWYFVFPRDSTPSPVQLVTPQPAPPQPKPAPFSLNNTLSGHQSTVWSVIFSADENALISGSEDTTIKIWNLNTGEVEKTLAENNAAIRTIQKSFDGTTLMSGGADGTLTVWSLPIGEPLRSQQAHDATIWSIEVHPNGQQFATASSDQTVKVWDLETGNLIHTLQGHTDWVFALAYSPDGSRLVSSDRGGQIKVWDPTTGQEISNNIPKQENAVRALAFEPRGQYLASASWDGTIKLWELATGKNHHTFSGHTDRVVSVMFGAVDNLMISSSIDRTIKVWDWKNQTLLDTLSGHDDWVLSTDINRSGQTLVSGAKDTTIKVWQRSQQTVD